MFQKHIHKVKFYPTADYFTQAPLVMLVTNIMSARQFPLNHILLNPVPFNTKSTEYSILFSQWLKFSHQPKIPCLVSLTVCNMYTIQNCSLHISSLHVIYLQHFFSIIWNEMGNFKSVYDYLRDLPQTFNLFLWSVAVSRLNIRSHSHTFAHVQTEDFPPMNHEPLHFRCSWILSGFIRLDCCISYRS